MQGFRFEGREKPYGRAGVCAYRRFLRRNAHTPIRPHVSSAGLARLALQPVLVPATNKAASQYARQSVTTGLIAGSDLVIVSISGVIKKYK